MIEAVLSAALKIMVPTMADRNTREQSGTLASLYKNRLAAIRNKPVTRVHKASETRMDYRIVPLMSARVVMIF